MINGRLFLIQQTSPNNRSERYERYRLTLNQLVTWLRWCFGPGKAHAQKSKKSKKKKWKRKNNERISTRNLSRPSVRIAAGLSLQPNNKKRKKDLKRIQTSLRCAYFCCLWPDGEMKIAHYVIRRKKEKSVWRLYSASLRKWRGQEPTSFDSSLIVCGSRANFFFFSFLAWLQQVTTRPHFFL